jgi:hypothetical protein
MTVHSIGTCHGCGGQKAVIPTTALDGTKARRCAPCLRIVRERPAIVSRDDRRLQKLAEKHKREEAKV